ncbi:MAG: alkaline phosphatase family protein, partial [Deltaproteobacteria bacterium]|nr:alkaline phosphatase family protein [Nannocystaceae bacterium]
MHRKTLSELRRLWSRRRALGGIASLGLAACAGDDADQGDGTTGGDSSDGTDASSSTAQADSSSETGDTGPIQSDCDAAGSLSVGELLAPVEHVIVVMMENRSFDHMFGALALEGRLVDGLTGDETNPDPDGEPVGVFLLTDPVVVVDPKHSWDGSREQWNGGANDGFVTSYVAEGAPDPSIVMGYYDRTTLPVSYALADAYSICDRWFCSVMGPTWPNRFHLHLGTSGGMTTNDTPEVVPPSIFDRLTESGITNVYYNSNVPFTLTYGKTEGVLQISDFFEAAAAGTLPQFSMIDPAFTDFATDPSMGTDDHPPADVTMGQAFLATVYAAIAQSPAWNRTLLVITYDEHGGFYDHVAPPTTTDDLPEFEQLGFRVPALVIGPHVRRGCTNSTTLDHVSVVSTVTRKWGLTPLNARVEATADLSSCIDPDFVDDPQPPAMLPALQVRRPKPGLTTPRGESHDELFAIAERHGFDPAKRHALAKRSLDAVLEWGERLGA